MQPHEPYYAEDTDGVHFMVDVDGHLVQAYLGRAVIEQVYGTVERCEACIDVYLAHQAVVDGAVVRHARAKGPETVLVKAFDLSPDNESRAAR